MTTSRHIQIARAVGAEFLSRKLRAISLLVIILIVALLGLGIWLVTLSAWWWILLVFIICGTVFSLVLLVTARIVIRIFRPGMSRIQKQAVNDFVDKTERIAETIQTPPFMIFFKILKDVISPREDTFIRQIADDSMSLRTDYAALSELF